MILHGLSNLCRDNKKIVLVLAPSSKSDVERAVDYLKIHNQGELEYVLCDSDGIKLLERYDISFDESISINKSNIIKLDNITITSYGMGFFINCGESNIAIANSIRKDRPDIADLIIFWAKSEAAIGIEGVDTLIAIDEKALQNNGYYAEYYEKDNDITIVFKNDYYKVVLKNA